MSFTLPVILLTGIFLTGFHLDCHSHWLSFSLTFIHTDYHSLDYHSHWMPFFWPAFTQTIFHLACPSMYWLPFKLNHVNYIVCRLHWLSFTLTLVYIDSRLHWLSYTLTLHSIDCHSHWLSISWLSVTLPVIFLTGIPLDWHSHWLSFNLPVILLTVINLDNHPNILCIIIY